MSIEHMQRPGPCRSLITYIAHQDGRLLTSNEVLEKLKPVFVTNELFVEFAKHLHRMNSVVDALTQREPELVEYSKFLLGVTYNGSSRNKYWVKRIIPTITKDHGRGTFPVEDIHQYAMLTFEINGESSNIIGFGQIELKVHVGLVGPDIYTEHSHEDQRHPD